MNLLGLMYSTNSTAALMRDGRIVACASEDRFARRKSIHAYPARAIDWCLADAGLRPAEIDLVVLPYEGIFTNFDKLLVDYDGSFSVRDKIQEQHEYYKPLLLEGRRPNFLEIFRHKVLPDRWRLAQQDPEGNVIRAALREHLNIPPERIVTVHHHLSHIYYAVYSQRTFRDPVLVFTMEGWGGDRNASLSIFSNGRLDTVYTTPECCIGRLYRYITLLLGMRSNQDEYKVMGLAPYASEATIRGALEVFRETMYVDGVEFKYRRRPSDLYFYFRDRLEGERFDAIAGALQRYTEEIIVQWVRNAVARTGIRDVLFTGGVAMNMKAMMAVGQLPEVRSLWVGATCTDESVSMGALFLAHAERTGRAPAPLQQIYLGNAASDADIEAFLAQAGGDARVRVIRDALPDAVAQRLAQGLVIGRYAGRAEFGARALGNRSILADPRSPAMVRRINEKIKNRDFWMPFAPVILEERQHDYLVNPKGLEAPYMTLGFETTPLARAEMPAALHPYDFTARPQILARADNPAYYDLVKAFERLTGVGALLNTSFNLHGEPIVCTLEDAWRVFTMSGLDGLMLGPHYIEKLAAPDGDHTRAELTERLHAG